MAKMNHDAYIRQETVTGTVPMLARDRQYSFWDLFLATSGFSIATWCYTQGAYVAQSLADYLQRHPEMEQHCSKGGQTRYLTSENPGRFAEQARCFLNEAVSAEHIDLSTLKPQTINFES
jgi:hypothetical protein